VGAEHSGTGTVICPVCQGPFVPKDNRPWCSEACRVAAWRRRRRAAGLPVHAAKAPGRRATTVHLCDSCGARCMGRRWCPACGELTRNIGFGGSCPHCANPVAVSELLDQVEAVLEERGTPREQKEVMPEDSID
jgi:endogenous inhibitor of DNA gyrase (YacG/DUF329 family)